MDEREDLVRLLKEELREMVFHAGQVCETYGMDSAEFRELEDGVSKTKQKLKELTSVIDG